MATSEEGERIALRCWGLADGGLGPMGQYLKSYEVDTGVIVWTHLLDEAMTFANHREAFELIHSVDPRQPVRPWDGQPNRPLTMFTIEYGKVWSFRREDPRRRS